MSGTTTFNVLSGTAYSNAVRPLARIEKTSSGNGLQNGATTHEQRRENSGTRALPKTSSRSETQDVPNWYSARLSAPFVAQILGQVLPQSGPDTASASAAYHMTPARLPAGLSFDREV